MRGVCHVQRAGEKYSICAGERGKFMIYEEKQCAKTARIFGEWQETMIWSCLSQVMGHIFVKDRDHPDSAMAMLGDFCFLAGVPEPELAAYKPEYCKQDFIIMVPQKEAWARCIETCYGEKAKRVTRYAMKKEGDLFDRKALERAAAGLPEEYQIRMIDEELFEQCRQIPWCRDFVAQYDTYEKYRASGLGAAVLKGDEIVSGASSYSSYPGGIEIEIDTREDYRRRGLAYAAGSRLILECLPRGWYPSWDAQNRWSVALAEKLGYHYSHAYTAYEIWGY